MVSLCSLIAQSIGYRQTSSLGTCLAQYELTAPQIYSVCVQISICASSGFSSIMTTCARSCVRQSRLTENASSQISDRSRRLTCASLIGFTPFQAQSSKDSLLLEQHISGPVLKINPGTVNSASHTAAVEFQVLLLLAILPQVALERRAPAPSLRIFESVLWTTKHLK